MNTSLPAQTQDASQANHSATAQFAPISMDESSLHNDHLSTFLRGIVLRWRVEQSIQQDEAQQILTGVKIIDFQTQKALVNHNTSTEHFAASINKLPVALLVLQDLRSGSLNMEQTMTWIHLPTAVMAVASTTLRAHLHRRS